MSDLFFYTAVVGLVIGCGVGTVWPPTSLLLYGILLVALMVWFVARRLGSAQPARYVFAVMVLLLCVVLGLVRTAFVPLATSPTLEPQVGEQVTMTGTVARELDHRTNSTHVYIRTPDALILTYADRSTAARYGDVVKVTGKLERPDSFTTDLGRTFNYPGYLRARGVTYTLAYAHVRVTRTGAGNPILATLLTAKHRFMAQIERVIPEPAVGLGEGLLLGVKQALGPGYETAFRRSGIMHIVVLSGYNVMLVVTFFMYILAYLLPYRARLMVGIAGIIGFALTVGLSATVVRAGIMAALVLLVRFHGFTHHVLRALMLAGLVMLAINPFLLLYDIGFQLSFVATLALILAAPIVERWFLFVPSWGGVREFLVATVTTQLCVTPLILYQIGQVSLVAVLANVLILPVVSVAMLLTFLAGVISFVSVSLGMVVGAGAYVSLSYILATAKALAGLPFAVVTVPAFSPLVLGLVYGVVVVIWCWLWYRAQQPKVPRQQTVATPALAGWVIEPERAGARRAPARSDTVW